MRLVFAGTPEVAVPALDALLASDRHEVVAVVTRPDAPSGRGRRMVASPVAARAEEAGIEVLKPNKPRDEDFLARLREIAPDCCPVVAYGALLPKAALDIPVHGWVNLHFSLLPAWRGAAPVQHAVLAGDEVTGASTFRIEEGLDSGPVFGVLTEQVRPTDTSGDLLTRLAFAGSGLLAATMDGIEDGTLKAVPQPAEGVSLAPKISVEDARIDWSAPALRCDRVVRGCAPRPRRLDGLPRRAAEGDVGGAHRGPHRPRARRARGRQELRPRRHRFARRRAAVGAAAGEEADEGRRLGPRRAHRPGEKLGDGAAA
ncbi:hypothetical protein GCM10020221_04450 [Streptomyces thioluteus]|uniref:Methionyl-tRNA formyltransferase n=1 Tax=Streptomyces thioluteus TaxID=66431 RepID=A0ABN3WDV5_STRTU